MAPDAAIRSYQACYAAARRGPRATPAARDRGRWWRRSSLEGADRKKCRPGSRVAGRAQACQRAAWSSARRSDRRGRRGGSRQDSSSSGRRGRLVHHLLPRTAQASTRRRRAT
eukprot:5796436-Prymnesium_polylepis.1